MGCKNLEYFELFMLWFLIFENQLDVYFAKLINTLIYTQFQPQAHDLVK
jgi:hypothetical protein